MILLLLAALPLSGWSADYTYLNIEQTDGSVVSLSAVGTSISFNDGYLVAGDMQIALTSLSKMYFSNTEGTTAINTLEAEDEVTLQNADAIYDLNGRQMTPGTTLRPGIYIVKKNQTTCKIQVR